MRLPKKRKGVLYTKKKDSKQIDFFVASQFAYQVEYTNSNTRVTKDIVTKAKNCKLANFNLRNI